ncbi:cell division suppressor protein YneA [Bacillus benzoevorans]|uniref:LysM repeat protein n=1 Tax=Bacillus benzoevorans TaxID=1456 RepID=A0A7X0HRE8_9BACI|nr:LysM peptidoglycan-binding domain-containing protein [Bacillus benzoevorans]MBB6444171.1 LysM repeat protein [Bacillus benzoevorans]
MKKLWSRYSYVMILVGLSLAGIIIFSFVFPTSTEDYLKITVSDGDTLWNLSEEYAGYHRLSNPDFIAWVEQYNGISGERIYAGQEIMIPVKDSAVEIDEISNLASN